MSAWPEQDNAAETPVAVVDRTRRPLTSLLSWQTHHRAEPRGAAGGGRRGFCASRSCRVRSAVSSQTYVTGMASVSLLHAVTGPRRGGVGGREQLSQLGSQVLDLEIVGDRDEAALPQLVAVVYCYARACARSALCSLVVLLPDLAMANRQ